MLLHLFSMINASLSIFSNANRGFSGSNSCALLKSFIARSILSFLRSISHISNDARPWFSKALVLSGWVMRTSLQASSISAACSESLSCLLHRYVEKRDGICVKAIAKKLTPIVAIPPINTLFISFELVTISSSFLSHSKVKDELTKSSGKKWLTARPKNYFSGHSVGSADRP